MRPNQTWEAPVGVGSRVGSRWGPTGAPLLGPFHGTRLRASVVTLAAVRSDAYGAGQRE
jgi:hypothetical protein